jgi:hypothetical protein
MPLKKAPAWLKRPCGATFGFSGKLVSFANQTQQVSDPSGQVKTVSHGTITVKQVGAAVAPRLAPSQRLHPSICNPPPSLPTTAPLTPVPTSPPASQLVTEPELVSRSESFEQAIAGGERSVLQQFCGAKAGEVAGDEAETWSFLGVLFEDDARRQLLEKLGFADAIKVRRLAAAPPLSGCCPGAPLPESERGHWCWGPACAVDVETPRWRCCCCPGCPCTEQLQPGQARPGAAQPPSGAEHSSPSCPPPCRRSSRRRMLQQRAWSSCSWRTALPVRPSTPAGAHTCRLLPSCVVRRA